MAVIMNIEGTEIRCDTAEEARSVLSEYMEQDPRMAARREQAKRFEKILRERCDKFCEGWGWGAHADRFYSSRLKDALTLLIKYRMGHTNHIYQLFNDDVLDECVEILDEVLPSDLKVERKN